MPEQVVVEGGVPAPAGLVEAVLAYEAALAADDLATLADFFAPGPNTMRSDVNGLLVGHHAITAFRDARGGVGPRTLRHLRLVLAGEDWLTVSVNAPAAGGRGVVTQLWNSGSGRWQIRAAHVTAPAKAMDARVWRVVGSPLVVGAADGPLAGHTLAVKDLFGIAGERVGVGSRVYLAEAPRETATAPAVQALIDAGVDVVGIAQTDQFAYSIAGLNSDYGTPPNPAVPGAIPGGSSSGPASAVAQGQASVGIGSDTAGSIRVPASYQGLWGLRTTHGAVSLVGVAPLAPRYDTVGWLTRDGDTLWSVARVGLAATPESVPRDREPSGRVVSCPGIDAAATGAARAAVDAVVSAVMADGPGRVSLPDPRELFEAFRVTQSAEAWRFNGAWVDAHPGALGPDVEMRFAWARAVTEEDEQAGLETVARLVASMDEALGDDVLVLPSAASAAPRIGEDSDVLNTLREATLGMTAVAGLTGRPALSVPLATTDAGPVGVCLVGPRGSDLALIQLGIEWESALRGGGTR